MRPTAPDITEFFTTIPGMNMTQIRTAITWTVLESHKELFFTRNVNAMLHGDERAHPVLPALKSQEIWDPDMVLDYFKTRPDNSDLSLPELSRKTVTLLMLATARCQIDIASLSLLHMNKYETKLLLNIPRACKTYKRAYFMNQMVTIEQFEDKKVCPMRALKKYISKTCKIRKSQNIFITTTPPYKAANTKTVD